MISCLRFPNVSADMYTSLGEENSTPFVAHVQIRKYFHSARNQIGVFECIVMSTYTCSLALTAADNPSETQLKSTCDWLMLLSKSTKY